VKQFRSKVAGVGRHDLLFQRSEADAAGDDRIPLADAKLLAVITPFLGRFKKSRFLKGRGQVVQSSEVAGKRANQWQRGSPPLLNFEPPDPKSVTPRTAPRKRRGR
jgi:hypothetical protein